MAISSRLSNLLLSALGLPDIRDELASYLNIVAVSSGQILVGNSGNIATGVTPTGDVTIDNTGVTAIGANKVVSSMLAKNLIQTTTVTVTTGQILALNTTPITLVAAPGTGLVLLPIAVYATITYGAAAYSTNAAGFTVRYTNGSGASTAMTLTQAFLQSSANAIQHVAAGTTAITPVANAPLVIYADNANPTTGDSNLKLQIWYRVVANPAF
jgi:hypothetical protein